MLAVLLSECIDSLVKQLERTQDVARICIVADNAEFVSADAVANAQFLKAIPDQPSCILQACITPMVTVEIIRHFESVEIKHNDDAAAVMTMLVPSVVDVAVQQSCQSILCLRQHAEVSIKQ